ncbi:MAG: hypothetical protein AAGI69_14660 [Cyanobacteria bacterium P01_H01_bin.21]
MALTAFQQFPNLIAGTLAITDQIYCCGEYCFDAFIGRITSALLSFGMVLVVGVVDSHCSRLIHSQIQQAHSFNAPIPSLK